MLSSLLQYPNDIWLAAAARDEVDVSEEYDCGARGADKVLQLKIIVFEDPELAKFRVERLRI